LSKAVEFDPGIVGRMVWGSLYKPNTKDFDGNPMTIKKGVDAGKPTQRFEFGLAVPKTQAHFANEPGWGQLIWSTAHAAFPGLPALMEPLGSDAFSWKITDGDATAIPKKSKSKVRPCDREGYAGHWVLKFSSSFPPKVYSALNLDNIVPLDGVDAIVPGYVIQVVGSVAGNTGNSPGIYLNHAGIALRGYQPEIRTAGVDVTKFGGGALPAGTSTLPVGAPAGAIPAAPAPSAAPAAPMPAAPAPAAPAPSAAAPAPVPVMPAPSFAGAPVAPAAPPPPNAAAAAPPPASRPPHKGVPYESYVKAGWTIDQLRADGYAG
jgi:hypothetical protein